MDNWKVVWQSPAKQEVRYFREHTAALRFAERMEARGYRNWPEVSYVGALPNLTNTRFCRRTWPA